MNGNPSAATAKANGSLSLDEEICKQDSAENQRPSRRDCFTHSVLLESVVILLIILSSLAVTGENLIRFDLITVPESGPRSLSESINITIVNDDSNNTTTPATNNSLKTEIETVQVNNEVMDILKTVFHYTSLGIAAFFGAEIIFKIIALCGKMFSEPWQIFDILVVILTLGVELAFHYVDLPWKGLYSVKYIVLLRLWRVPFVCSMKAQKVQDSLEQDIDVYRSDQQKAEEKCVQLELSLSQQAEIIKQLEGALQTFTHEREAASYELNPSDLLRNSKPSPLPRKTIPGAAQLKRSLLRRSRRKESSDMMETEFTSKTDGSARHKKGRKPYNPNVSDEDDIDASAPSVDHGFVSDAVDGEDPFVSEAVDNVLDTSQFQLRPKSESRDPSQGAPAAVRPIMSPRRKTRRSSTSEYLDYARLTESCESNSKPNSKLETIRNSEPDLSTHRKTLPCGDKGEDGGKGALGVNSSHSNSSASDTSNHSHSSSGDQGQYSIQPETWSSGGLSEDSSVNGDGASEDVDRTRRQKGKKVRRFSSCPEYAYTQRMTITSEESAFIGDDESSDEVSIHDNLGYVVTEQEALHVLAEFDGTKTYRSEEGIPMTSL